MKEYVVGKEADFPEGASVAVEVGRRQIAVVRVDGKFHAINNVCSHKGASLCEGRIDKDRNTIRCPWHLWDWSLESGQLLAHRNRKLPTFEVKVVDGEVLLYV